MILFLLRHPLAWEAIRDPSFDNHLCTGDGYGKTRMTLRGSSYPINGLLGHNIYD